MLSRLNPEHIFACANLLNISNSLSLTELSVSSMSEWISSNEYTGHNCFFISIVAHSQSVYSGWESCDSKYRSNLLKSRQLKIFFLSTLNRWFLSFYSSSVLKHSKTNLCASNPWRNGSASDSRSEGCVFKQHRDQLFAFPAVNLSLSHCTAFLCRKKAASIAALNLLLNAVSSQFGTHSCVFKTFNIGNSSFVSESHHTNTENYFFFNFGHVRKAFYSAWVKLWTAMKKVTF